MEVIITPQVSEEYKDLIGNTEKLQVTETKVHQGNLLLINSLHPVMEIGILSDVIKLSEYDELVQGFKLDNSTIQVSKRIILAFTSMISNASKEGFNQIQLNSGYRSFDEQNFLFNEMGAEYALPAGYSEHNSALSLDVGVSRKKIEHSREGRWINRNASKYGFVIRYPKDKEHITGINYEPWHIRYVGLPHSVIMDEMDFVLEEYLEYLQEQEQILVTVNEETFVIKYYYIKESTIIDIPIDYSWDLSGNNIDGVILTIRL